MATPIDTPFGFTGQGIDRLDSGQLVLYDYKGREYNPRLGRFIQRDPSGPADSYNLYEYVKSRATVARDPTGKDYFGISMGVGLDLAFAAATAGAIFAAHQAASDLQSLIATHNFSIDLTAMGVGLLMAGNRAGESLIDFGELVFFSHKGRKEVVEHADSLGDEIKEHIDKLLEVASATGGPPDDPNWKHWKTELEAWLDDIEKDLSRMGKKTAKDWAKEIAEWRKQIDKHTGGGGVGA